MKKETLKVQNIQDKIFKKMSVGQKIKITSKLYTLGRKLQQLKVMSDDEVRNYIDSLIKEYGVFATIHHLEKIIDKVKK